MLIKFNIPKTQIVFIHENAIEYRNMMFFPAFIKEGPFFYIPAKVHVVYNVITRLQTFFKKMVVDKEVIDFMNQEMKLENLPSDFKFITKPLPFQEIALRYLYTVGSGGLLLAPGMGKSKVVLDYISLMKFKLSIIICPLPLLFVWNEEVIKHRSDLSIHLVETTDWKEEWNKGKDKNIICMNYSKATIFEEELKKCNFEFIHLDEFLIKDPSSIRTKSISNISKRIPYKCGGSGTLVNNSILDVFAPIRYLEPSLVGFSFSNFRKRHTITNPNDPRLIVATTKSTEVKSILESCCIVMSKEEWLQLPEKNIHDIYVNLGEDQKEFYKNLSSNYIASVEDHTIEIDNALVLMSKLYQASNGFVYVNETKEDLADLLAEESNLPKKKTSRKTKFFKSQPKIDALLNLLNTKIKNKRAIVWFNMQAEYELISEALINNDIKFITIKGGDKKIGEKVSLFNNDPNFTILLCQAKSVNYGITVLGTTLEKLEDSDIQIFSGVDPSVHTQIFYSCNFSLEVYLQQQDRIHRIGQAHICDYYRIFANTNVEHRIRKALDEKMSIRKEILVDIAEKLKEQSSFLV